LLTELCYGTEIERIPVPTPLKFYRDYVAVNKPCIIEVSLPTKLGDFPSHDAHDVAVYDN
jgi:hypothetical protein